MSCTPNGNNRWLVALLVWNIWNCISIVWAKDTRGLISTEIIIFEALAFIYYGQKLITSKERFVQLIDTLTMAVFAHNCLGWLEVTRKIYLFSRYSDKYSRLGYPVSTFTNTNNYGFYLALMAIMLLTVFLSTQNIRRKIVSGGLFVSSILLLVRTGSRGAIIAFVFGVILFTLITMRNKKMAGRIALVLIVLATVVVEDLVGLCVLLMSIRRNMSWQWKRILASIHIQRIKPLNRKCRKETLYLIYGDMTCKHLRIYQCTCKEEANHENSNIDLS